MILKTIKIAAYVLLMLSSTSASALIIEYTFDVSSAQHTFKNAEVSGILAQFKLMDGQKMTDDTSGVISATSTSVNFNTTSDYYSLDVKVKSGGETITNTGFFKLSTSNKGDRRRGFSARSALRLNSNLSFDFTFGTFTLKTSNLALGQVTSTNGTKTGDLRMNASFDEIAAVPLPAALPLFGASLAAMSFFGGWRRKQKAA